MWKYTPEDSGDGLMQVPQTQAQQWETPLSMDCHRSEANESKEQESCRFISPLYEKLETNIPIVLMRFSDLNYPNGTQLFPKHTTIQDYLEKYGKEVLPMITFNTQVTNIAPHVQNTSNDASVWPSSWQVQTKHIPSGLQNVQDFDAVVVANGHYSVPFIPDLPGLAEWDTEHPGSISHAKYYRNPAHLKGKRVVIIGGAASGLDIASQAVTVSKPPILVSQRSDSFLSKGFLADPNIQFVPEIASVDAASRSVTFVNGRTEERLDCLLFCTGYLYSMPFLEDLEPGVIGDGMRVERTYQHLLYAPNPTMSFLMLTQKVVPFPVAEAQAAFVARVYSGRLQLPSLQIMEEWETTEMQDLEDASHFHSLQFPKDANYINMLCDAVAQADRRPGLANHGHGKLPKRWGPAEFWARPNFPDMRKAFVAKGEARKGVTDLSQLGFVFDQS